MKYQDINNYSRKWIFTHASMPVVSDDLQQIKPFTAQQSAMFWQENISRESPDSERFAPKDWASNLNNWLMETNWIKTWESDDDSFPVEIEQYLTWQDDVTVYFCYEKYNVIETTWKVFKNNWKNFLFYDDGPILLARRREQALWFLDNGKVKLGKRR